MLKDSCILLPDNLKKELSCYRQWFSSFFSYRDDDSLKSFIRESACRHFVHLSSKVNFFFDMEYFLSQIKSPRAVSLSFKLNEGDEMASVDSDYQIDSFKKFSSFYVDGLFFSGISYFTKQDKDFIFQFPQTPLQGIPLPLRRKQENPRPALFLDRDGVIIHDLGYVHLAEQAVLYEEIIPLIRFINDRKWWVFVISNQSGVGRGKFPASHVDELHLYLRDLLASKNAFIDDWFYCSYHEQEGREEFKKKSLLRKPCAGMILRACEKYPVDLSKSFVIGDKLSDKINLPGLNGCHIKRNHDLTQALWPVFSQLPDILRHLKKSLAK
ncbi:MAG: HAD-IIIA family hydrolase [Halobacteriovoraceae bacterium]|nr:HAD-IIIA family hydrolase [Halobacteriovoraceae bacterium]